MLTYFQAIVLGVLQGVTELFPVSSLGHSVILPQLLGWTDVVAAQSATESYFLAFLVGLHVATALALLVFYRATWARIVARPGRLAADPPDRDARPAPRLAARRGDDPGRDRRPAPRAHAAGRVRASRWPPRRSCVVNGLILLFGEWVRRRAEVRRVVAAHATNAAGDRRLDTLEFREAAPSGSPRSSRSCPGSAARGSRWSPGLARGLDHEDAARFSFLLATPIILAAGLYKLPDLLGPNGDGVRPQILVGSIAAAIAAYLSVRFLTRWFATRTLLPFAIYCLVVGVFGDRPVRVGRSIPRVVLLG